MQFKFLHTHIITTGLCVLSLLGCFSGYCQSLYIITANTNWSALSPTPTSADYIEVKKYATLTVDVSNAVCDNITLARDGGTLADRGDGFLVFNSGSQLTATVLRIGNGDKNGYVDMTNGGIFFMGNNTENGNANTAYLTAGTGTIILSNGSTLPTSVNFNTFNNLTISSGAVSLAQHITINGNLSITSGSISAGTFNIDLKGNWSITSSDADPFKEGTGSVSFTGSNPQTITNANRETFYNLAVNNTSAPGISLSPNTNISITNLLTLTDGIIDARTNNCLVSLPDNASLSGGNANSYIIGKMSKTGDDAFVFPLGDSTIWARIGISAPDDVTDAFEAEYFFTSPPYAAITDGTLSHVSDNEYWMLNEMADGGAATAVSVTLHFEDTARSGITDVTTTDLRVAKHTGSLWTDMGQSSISGKESGSVTSALISSFSPFTFGSLGSMGNPLPVELLGFDAQLNGDQVDLTWSTASETNNDYFTIEKSKDGTGFEEVADIQGAGNSSTTQYYKVTDEQPCTGISYYRLKQTDFDGRFSYSDLVAVNYMNDVQVSVFPNPAEHTLHVNLSNMNVQEVLLILFSPLGEIVYSKTANKNDLITSIDLQDHLSPGLYVLVGSNKNELFRKKVIVK